MQLAQSVPTLSTLVTAVKAGGLVGTLSGKGPFTVFAPTNDAFSLLGSVLTRLLKPEYKTELDELLTYHVVAGKVTAEQLQNGEKITTIEGAKLTVSCKTGKGSTTCTSDVEINGIEVLVPDNEASNGVVHIINGVLIPRAPPGPPGPPPPPAPGPKNIVQLAESVPSLSTLVTAVVKGNLSGVLSSPGPYTVFAPNNNAFSKIPPATLKSLLDKANIKELVAVLELHVISGRFLAKDIQDGQKVKTVEGEELTFTKYGGKVFVYSKKTAACEVISADNAATNGVVHIVNKVLLPSNITAY